MKQVGNRIHLWAMAVVCLLLAGCGATPIETVDPALVGAWQGECEISLPVVFNPTQLPETVQRTKTTVPLALTFEADASVAGAVGAATIEASVLKYNRSELGRMLNMASDYIVIGGYLSGPIVPGEDENAMKSFTIPFDLVDGRIQGGLMWLEQGKYPYPLCQVDLGRAP